MFEGRERCQWDHTASILFRIAAAVSSSPPSFEDFHPYRLADRKRFARKSSAGWLGMRAVIARQTNAERQ